MNKSELFEAHELTVYIDGMQRILDQAEEGIYTLAIANIYQDQKMLVAIKPAIASELKSRIASAEHRLAELGVTSSKF